MPLDPIRRGLQPIWSRIGGRRGDVTHGGHCATVVRLDRPAGPGTSRTYRVVVTAPRRDSALGAAVTLEELDGEPYDVLARLRRSEPVAWVRVLDGWLVTRRDLCIEVMRDARRFTVD